MKIEKPTAKEFLLGNADRFQRTSPDEWMIEFAKLHVEAALKAASELEETDGTEGYKIYPDSILTAYPLENIK